MLGGMAPGRQHVSSKACYGCTLIGTVVVAVPAAAPPGLPVTLAQQKQMQVAPDYPSATKTMEVHLFGIVLKTRAHCCTLSGLRCLW